MAKRKDFRGVIDGIIGPAPTEQKAPAPSESTPTAAPKAAAPSAEIRATFIVEAGIIRKIKFIGLATGMMHKRVVAEALSEYVAKYEAEHGPINI